jgi:8-oxo-dGTP diphosphatase
MSYFHGAKVAVLSGDRILTILRDDIPTIRWPGHWDLPGGARDGEETPENCALRELREELGILLTPGDLCWRKSALADVGPVWFFVAEMPSLDTSAIRFGDEGQEWRLAPLDWYLNEAKAVPHQVQGVRQYLAVRP